MFTKRIATVTLTSGVEATAEFNEKYDYFYVRNDTADVVYISLSPPITAGADGVLKVPVGQSVGTMHGYPADKLYLLGSGDVQICGCENAINPFSSRGGGGGENSSVEYNIVKTSPSGVTSEYHLTKTVNGVTENIGDAIDVPLDMVVQSGDVKTCSVANVPVQGYKVGDKYIDLLIANSNNQHIYILVSDLVDNNASGIKYDNTSSGLAATNVQTAINELNTNKATTTALTVHTNNNNIHVTAEDKTAWNMMPKSKGEIYSNDIHSYQDFVIPILNIASTYSNEWFYGQIFLKRTNGAGQQMTIINLMCGKHYNEEKAVYYMDKSQMWTATKPCSFVYNGKKMFGIHVKIIASDYNILRVDARTTTNFDSITPVYIYNNNTSAVLNAEIYNSLSFFDGYNMPWNFYEIPNVIKSDGTLAKLLSFSPVPASATATGTKGDIAYDSGYMYVCTDTNTWKRTPLTTW